MAFKAALTICAWTSSTLDMSDFLTAELIIFSAVISLTVLLSCSQKASRQITNPTNFIMCECVAQAAM
ncbi:hypothetical protein D3C85_1793120 [compost metagenome]